MRKRLEATIFGRVQGVLYRDFARREAGKLGIVGTVENVPKGEVRVVADGEEEKLHEFLAALKKGPAFAQVANVVVRWSDAAGEYSDFRIVYHGLLDRL